MAVLRVKNGPEKGKIYDLAAENMLMGRDRGGAIQILDQGASRQHAEVFSLGELHFVRDLKSRNGTYVNSEKIDEVVLRFGDQIQIGNTVLVFEDRGARFMDSDHVIREDAPGASAPDPSTTLTMKVGDTRPGGRRAAPPPAADTAESRRLQALLSVSNIVGSERNLSRILTLAAAELGRVVDADNVFIFQVKPQPASNGEQPKEDLRLIGRYDRSEELQNEGTSSTIIRDCLKQGRAVLTSDAGLDSRYNTTASVVMQRIKSVICVPITGIGQNIGVVYASNSHRPEAFDSEDLELASAVAVQLGTAIQLLAQIRRSDLIFRNSIRTLVAAIEMRDPFNKGRAERVAAITLSVAKQLNWNTHDCRNAWIAGMLYDIGSIPLSDRDREAKFSMETRKNHYAAELLNEMPGLGEILPAIVQQNERHDGSGSPEGIQGDEIDPLARILALALTFDRILHPDDTTQPAPSQKDALKQIMETSGKTFSPECVKALIGAFKSGDLFQQDVSFFEASA